MVRLKWTKQAINDLRDIAEYISKDSKNYANSLVQRIRAKVRCLEINLIVEKWWMNLEERM